MNASGIVLLVVKKSNVTTYKIINVLSQVQGLFRPNRSDYKTGM
jgi:hypothetical protein